MRTITLLFMITFLKNVYSQEVPCRQWYYSEDKNGNKIKEKCKSAWQENSNGQKHGKYIEYYENGNPSFSGGYINGELEGAAKNYLSNGHDVASEGYYRHDMKIGIWKYHQMNTTVNYDEQQVVYKWNSVDVISSFKNQTLNGQIVLAFYGLNNDFGNGGIEINKDKDETFILNRNYDPDANEFMQGEMKSNDFYKLTISKEVINKILFWMKKGTNNLNGYQIIFKIENGQIVESINSIYDLSNKFIKNANVLSEGDLIRQRINQKRQEIANIKQQQEAESTLAQKKAIEADSSDSKNGLSSVTFEVNSYQPNSGGINSLKAFENQLGSIKLDDIKHLIFISHSNCCGQYNMNYFDPKDNEPLRNPQTGRESINSVKEMSELSLILSVARVKQLFRLLQNNDQIKTLLASRRLWLLPAGSLYGNQITQGTHHNSVQIIIIKSDGTEINTEPIVWIGSDLNSSKVITNLNDHIGALGWNINKLLSKYLNPQTYLNEIPTWSSFSDPNFLAGFIAGLR